MWIESNSPKNPQVINTPSAQVIVKASPSLSLMPSTSSAGVDLKGSLVALSGVPLSGQQVTLSVNGQTPTAVTTGADGSFDLSPLVLPAGTYTVKASYAGNSYYLPMDLTTSFTLSSPGAVVGRSFITRAATIGILAPLPLAGGDPENIAELTIEQNQTSAKVTVFSGAVQVGAAAGGANATLGPGQQITVSPGISEVALQQTLTTIDVGSVNQWWTPDLTASGEGSANSLTNELIGFAGLILIPLLIILVVAMAVRRARRRGVSTKSSNSASQVLTSQTLAQRPAMAQTHCRNCNSLIAINASFCENCGVKLESAKVCASCGTGNPSDSDYCIGCGKKL